MLEFFRNFRFQGMLYIKIKSSWLSMKEISSGKRIEDVPVMAISEGANPTILSIGKNAERDAKKQGMSYTMRNGFEHPRTIIADFTTAEKTIMYFIREITGKSIFRPSPVVIVHPLEHLEGGLTAVEARALQELALGAGAREVYVWTGRELTDQEIKNGKFPGDHWAISAPNWAKA